ncbi:SDR family oxidoreductase [Frankia sp. CNm7]|uniref:SDR family oxidoreductase n=1 Tax=Frankia nepalensis TaxID=1836974 RepID=A0A937RMZ3_9ACTN|nr:SDR family oxidoreductase [Frankia nepalensis]MBL7500298.1 SDR family oxidoreductase [Frankia nepalensis]MBL7511999.1 SDR family oxidoreductase [Frankia nepalensis]MBL7521192.1 SDR family oxidoreductase [Frankia nepalensis]MBL7631759.1 SDR family oxidoreductase [Frankia nepalensis]
MDLGLADATAVVQGGSRGMGRAAAECLAAEGAKVGVLARRRADADKTVARLIALGAPDAVALLADITNPVEVTAAFELVRQRWGALNILVNTAGPSVGGRFEELSDDDWRRAVDAGALGMIRCVRAALPLLRAAEWARVVNLSAQSTKRQSPSLVAFTAAKSVVTSVTKNLAQSLADDEILVNTVSPGAVLSDSLAGWARRNGVDPEDPYAVMRGITELVGHPAFLPRAGLPHEVGRVIAFVASRHNSYMTGANINVDGGSDFC